MSLKDPKFPSSEVFEVIAAALKSDSFKKVALEKGDGIFAFTLENSEAATKSWYLDLKNSGTVGVGSAPEGASADVELSMSDENFAALVDGSKSAQELFMSGQLQLKGNMMKAMNAQPVIERAKEFKAKL
ncbi:hypothetical protein CANCADRAFT_31055 [Tortispora caseinolytica NRRL Y-17796]|uniref:SCP2 domain-containing protein n=1 Tax=Tortispora caseinolytica NRRL Y-17796 TaxID=767744 RepID=A0A1E4TE64_9ASCO|nr:hypothetical protein CANCADRAFT_31055 [Tortispora caseinolytica NRRL Y-17796]